MKLLLRLAVIVFGLQLQAQESKQVVKRMKEDQKKLQMRQGSTLETIISLDAVSVT